ncbi:MAG: hypothetical protein HZA51_07460 [Planctomycetes bacterium]|nr:hypothetical protein [Planctomycetota bacterium]
MVVRIGLVGDFSQSVVAHSAIPEALKLAAEQENVELSHEWLSTDELASAADSRLAGFHGFWCTPGSPYRSMEGAIRAIRYAREAPRPFLGTCGGFQHAVVEIARNLLNIPTADHHEYNSSAADAVITPLECSLIEVQGHVHVARGSRLHAAYGRNQVTESYHCSYGLNEKFRAKLNEHPIACTAFSDTGEVRAIELPDHPFFVATLFQPERSALNGKAHPLITTFLSAAIAST